MNSSFASMMSRLLAALEAAMGAETVDATRVALDEAFGVLGALYAALDSGRHPELSAYLLRAYDGCLRHIGEARPGRCQGLVTAITLLRHIQQAEACAQDANVERPSFHAHAAALV